MPQTLTIQYMYLFSQRTVQVPSVMVSQKYAAAVWRPEPFFWVIVTRTDNKFINVKTRGSFYANVSGIRDIKQPKLYSSRKFYESQGILTNVLKRLLQFIKSGHSLVGDYRDPIRSTGVAVGVSSEA